MSCTYSVIENKADFDFDSVLSLLWLIVSQFKVRVIM